MSKFNKIIRKKTENQLIKEFTTAFKKEIEKKARSKQRFSLVLSGGSSPIKLYKSLSRTNIDWDKVDFFLADERHVPNSSKNSNYNLVKKVLLDKIKVDKKNIFFIKTKSYSLSKSSQIYKDTIQKYFKYKKIVFDLVLLGMGIDGHIASIFPENKSLKKKIIINVKRKDFNRISLSLNSINSSKRIFLWLNNKKKSKIYNKIKIIKNLPVNLLNKRKVNLFILKN